MQGADISAELVDFCTEYGTWFSTYSSLEVDPETGNIFPNYVEKDVNFAVSPPRMAINSSSGLVTWETGKGSCSLDLDAELQVSRYSVDSTRYGIACSDDGLVSYDDPLQAAMIPSPNGNLPNGQLQSVTDVSNCTYAEALDIANRPLQPGIYNVVVQVESDAHVAEPTVQTIKIPIDLLLYLYSPMHYCSLDCKSSSVGGNPTFSDPSGFYGQSNNNQCKICGGGYTNSSIFWPSCDLTGFSQRLGIREGNFSHPLVFNFTQCVPEDNAPLCDQVDNYGNEFGVPFQSIEWGGYPFPLPRGVNETIYESIVCSKDENIEFSIFNEVIPGRAFLPSVAVISCENSCPQYTNTSDCLAGGFVDPLGSDSGDEILPIQGACLINLPPVVVDINGTNIDGTLADDTTTPPLTVESSFSLATISAFFCDVVTYDVVVKDIDHCTDLSIISLDSFTGQSFLSREEMGSEYFDFPSDERQIRRRFVYSGWNFFSNGTLNTFGGLSETDRAQCVLDTLDRIANPLNEVRNLLYLFFFKKKPLQLP